MPRLTSAADAKPGSARPAKTTATATPVRFVIVTMDSHIASSAARAASDPAGDGHFVSEYRIVRPDGYHTAVSILLLESKKASASNLYIIDNICPGSSGLS